MLKIIKDKLTGKVPSGAKRSSQWPKVRKEFLKNNPTCAVCGGKTKLEVHHIVPFHVQPELELDPNNLIALCEQEKYGINCHLLVGHHGNYKKANPSCREDATEWNHKLLK